MVAKKATGFLSGMADIDHIGSDVNPAIKGKPVSTSTGRPKLNPYAEEKKLIARIPEDIHDKLKHLSIDLKKPMVELVVDALIDLLAKHDVKP